MDGTLAGMTLSNAHGRAMGCDGLKVSCLAKSSALRILALALCLTTAHAAEVDSPFSMATALEARTVAGDGVTLPDPTTEIVRNAGAVDLARGDWPTAFLDRVGKTICVAVSPFTGNYEFFDETGDCFFTLVPAFPTTENWVAPFRHAEEGTFPDDDLYAPLAARGRVDAFLR